MHNLKLSLLVELTKRDIAGKFKDTALGFLWIPITPVFSLLIYYYIFGVIFQARWQMTNTDVNFVNATVAPVLFIGLICFNFFSECFSRAPSLMRENTNYIKKIVFPIGIFPLVVFLGALFNMIINFFILIFFYLIIIGIPPVTTLLVPIILIPLFLMMLGVIYGVSGLGVYLPDLKHVVPPITMAFMFLTPIFYPLSLVPENMRFFVKLNPMTTVLEQARELLFIGQVPSLGDFWISCTIGTVCFVVGYVFFRKTQKGFADVL